MSLVILDVETTAVNGAAEFCDPVTPPANYRDQAKIDAYIAEKTAERLDRLALDLDLARIVAIGVHPEKGQPDVLVCQTEADERAAFQTLRSLIQRADLVTFNGLAFDLPLIERRHWYLGLPSLRWNLDRYRSNHIDLYQRLTLKGAVQAHRLSWYRKRLGWLDIPETIDASAIGQAVADGRWEDVRAHCLADLELTRRLALWMGVWPKDEALALPLTDERATEAVL